MKDRDPYTRLCNPLTKHYRIFTIGYRQSIAGKFEKMDF